MINLKLVQEESLNFEDKVAKRERKEAIHGQLSNAILLLSPLSSSINFLEPWRCPRKP